MDLKKTNIIIATHYLVYGAPQALREYLLNKRIYTLLFIGHPLKNDITKSYKERVDRGKVIKNEVFPIRTPFNLLNYFIESVLTFLWVISERKHFHVYFGVDPLNACIGIVLKKIGKVRKVVYYTIDYVPVRFQNSLLNNLYHLLDRWCLTHADQTWNVSPRIAEGRESIRGLKLHIYNKQVVVPIGVWMDKVKRLPFEKIHKQQLLFIGNLLEKQGVQIVIDAIPHIIKQIPGFHFLIVGGGEYENSLRSQVRNLKLEKYVTFTGWIKNRAQIDSIMADSALAIAMYDKNTDNFTYYADPTKLKDYMSAGLPILLTDVPYNAKEIEQSGCGKIIEYNARTVARTIIQLLKNETQLRRYRKNTIRYISRFEWSNIFKERLDAL